MGRRRTKLVTFAGRSQSTGYALAPGRRIENARRRVGYERIASTPVIETAGSGAEANKGSLRGAVTPGTGLSLDLLLTCS